MTNVLPPSGDGHAVDTLPPPPDFMGVQPPGERTRSRPRLDFAHLPKPAMALVLLGAILANLALRSHVSSVASLLAVVCTAGVLALSGNVNSNRARLLVGAAVLVACWLPLRTSGWLTNLNGWSALALLLAAALFGSGPAPHLSVPQGLDLLRRVLVAGYGPALLTSSARASNKDRSAVVVSVARGLLVAVLPVAVLGTLLASADVVFASTISPRFSAGPAIGHIALTVLAAFTIAGLVCICRSASRIEGAASQPIGAVEAFTALTSIALLFGLFAVTQLIGALGGAEQILEREGLTRAEYARTGFFQLLFAAGLTLLLVTALRALTSRESSYLGLALRLSGAAVSMLTLVIVAVSIMRLHLYTDAFGLTTLRWYSTTFAWLLGVVFALLAASHLVRTERHWFGWATLGVTLAVLIGVNVANPESRVASHNLDRPATSVPLDAEYLSRLSADAWPTLLGHREQVTDALPGGATAFELMCEAADRHAGYGPFGTNLSRTRLDCSTTRGPSGGTGSGAD